MSINTQQFITTCLILNFLIGTVIGATMTDDGETYAQDLTNDQQYIRENLDSAMTATEYQQDDQNYEKTIGDPGETSTLVKDAFKYGFISFPLWGAEGTLEKILARTLVLFQTLLWTFSALLVIDKIKNKKVD